MILFQNEITFWSTGVKTSAYEFGGGGNTIQPTMETFPLSKLLLQVAALQPYTPSPQHSQKEPKPAQEMLGLQVMGPPTYFHFICWYDNSGFHFIEFLPNARYFIYIILTITNVNITHF